MSFFVFLMGLCSGSFVNMLIYRIAINYKLESHPSSGGAGKSKVKSHRSVCDFCGRQLKWYENIPVLSWMIQRGKSRCCQKKLPVLYPIVEIGTGILFVINYQLSITNYPSVTRDFASLNHIQMILGIVAVTMLVFATVFDLKYMILPDFSTLILIITAFLRLVVVGFDWGYIISAIGASGFLGFLYLITKGKGMGFGDVKLAVFMGLWLGWPQILLAFYVAFISGAIVGSGLMMFKKLKRKSQIAFGPFLILGTVVSWWWGEKLIFNLKFLMFN